MKSVSLRVARRYARAVASLCVERGDAAAVRAAFDTLITALDGAPGALAFLANPTVRLNERAEVLRALLDGCQIQGAARDTACLLLDKGRIAILPALRAEFAIILDAQTGRVEGKVTSAAPLSDAALARLQGLLKRQLGKEVSLSTAVDPALIGGLVVQIGHTVFDASIAHQLERLRQQLGAQPSA